MTFAHAVEKVGDGDSGRSRVAIIDRGKIPAERLHPKAGYSRCQPTGFRLSAVDPNRPIHASGERASLQLSHDAADALSLVPKGRPTHGVHAKLAAPGASAPLRSVRKRERSVASADHSTGVPGTVDFCQDAVAPERGRMGPIPVQTPWTARLA